MQLTPKVKEILSWYESDNPGTKANIARILMEGRLGGTGRMVILPVDQGFEHGPARSFAPNPAAYDPRYHFELAVEAGLNAYAAPLGMIEAGASTYAGAIPTILKVNSSNSLASASIKDQAVTGSVNDALRLGCSAIGFTIYPSSDDQFEMMEELRELAEDAKAAGLAVVVWSYPRGPGLDKKGETALDICAYAAHIAALMGAHIIKVKPPTEAISLEAAKKTYEKSPVPDTRHARRAHPARGAGLLQRPAAGGVLRRRGRHQRRDDGHGARHPPGRRQRLHHRPQHLPAAEGGRAEAAGRHHRRVQVVRGVTAGATPAEPAAAAGKPAAACT